MASGFIGNEVPRKGLRVRVPCPPPPEPVFSLAFFVFPWDLLVPLLTVAIRSLSNGRGFTCFRTRALLLRAHRALRCLDSRVGSSTRRSLLVQPIKVYQTLQLDRPSRSGDVAPRRQLPRS